MPLTIRCFGRAPLTTIRTAVRAAQRIAAQVVILEAETGDQGEAVVGQYVGRIESGIVRLAAFAMRAQVRHDQAEAAACDLGGMAEADPVGAGVGEQAVQQHDRRPLAQFVPGKLRPVRRREMVGLHLIRSPRRA